jgi:hypothetical protein
MRITQDRGLSGQTLLVRTLAFVGRVLLAVAIPLIAFYVLYLGFLFLRDSEAPRSIVGIVTAGRLENQIAPFRFRRSGHGDTELVSCSACLAHLLDQPF